jgi:hypothetical protein
LALGDGDYLLANVVFGLGTALCSMLGAVFGGTGGVVYGIVGQSLKMPATR